MDRHEYTHIHTHTHTSVCINACMYAYSDLGFDETCGGDVLGPGAGASRRRCPRADDLRGVRGVLDVQERVSDLGGSCTDMNM